MVHCHISKDLKEMALSMSLQGLGDSEIREYTGISSVGHRFGYSRSITVTGVTGAGVVLDLAVP
jgi:hypothetical protein